MMNAGPREIPGYYYDPDKKKYFKIQANHTVPSGSKYSKDDVKKKKNASLKRKRVEEHSNRVAAETIKRSELLRYPLAGGLLKRELGAYRTSRSQLLQQDEACIRLFERHRLANVSCNIDFPVSKFIRDPATGTLLLAINMCAKFNLLSYTPTKSGLPWRYNLHQRIYRPVMAGHDWVSSISMGMSSDFLVTSSSPTGESVHVTAAKVPRAHDDGGSRIYAIEGSTTFCFPGDMIWSSATCPDPTANMFAVGKSSNLLLVNNIGSGWDLDEVKLRSGSNIMAVEWLTPKMVMMGLADSHVTFHDVRSGGIATRLQHPHGVLGVRKADEYRIVVAGQKSNLHMYDLRFAPNGIATHPQPNNYHHTSTKPYLSFPDFATENISNDELAVSPELDLLACTSSSNKIQLFSLSTGKLVMPAPVYPSSSLLNTQKPRDLPRRPPRQSINAADATITRTPYSEDITCLRFENLDESPAMNGAGGMGKPSLLMSTGCMVEEWRM
ncbi:hypothetical protein FQN53_005569 [Emmonsiellopsis sp. PD_33]|nr:hypothetical protein FQN53_005569 [Emmonsiellopsis sp. PD_33]